MKKMLATAMVFATIGLGSLVAGAVEDEADLTIPLSQVPEAGLGDIYGDAETMALYQESNDLPGLQTTPTDHDDDPETDDVPADTLLAAAPA